MTGEACNDAPYRLIADVEFGANVIVQVHEPLRCLIGDDTRIGPFVEIQRGAVIGRRCKIQSHTFVCDGIVIEDEVFVGHGVMFINDRFPRAATASGELKSDADWQMQGTTVERGAAIGSGAVILGGLRIGADALVGAGAVVTRDVAAVTIVPATRRGRTSRGVKPVYIRSRIRRRPSDRPRAASGDSEHEPRRSPAWKTERLEPGVTRGEPLLVRRAAAQEAELAHAVSESVAHRVERAARNRPAALSKAGSRPAWYADSAPANRKP